MNNTNQISPVIEPGEFFVVTRGFKFNTSSVFAVFSGFNDGRNDEVRYDRSHEGLVYQAVEVCGAMIAGRVVACESSHKSDRVGNAVSLNTNEVEVWPVTRQYVEALGVQS